MKKKIISVLLCFIICLLYLFIFQNLPIPKYQNVFLSYLLLYLIMSILLLIGLFILHKMSILKFQWKSFFKGLKLGSVFMILGILLFAISLISLYPDNSLLPIFDILLFLVAIIVGTGFTEEVLCRGIVYHLLQDNFGDGTRKGVFTTVVFSALIFGLCHLSNIFSGSSNLLGSCLQVISTFGMGLFLGSIYARTRSIWAVAFLHGFWDFCGMVQKGFFGIGKVLSIHYSLDTPENIGRFLGALTAILVIFTFYFVYHRVLLRKKKIHECLEEQ